MFEVEICDLKTNKCKNLYLPVGEIFLKDFEERLTPDENVRLKIKKCKAIPELNGAAFAENATLDELNFLAKRIDVISKDQTQICAYRTLMSEPPDNICDAINRTYGLETVPVYPCENVEEYGEIVLDNDFLEELDEIPYELYDLLDREKVGALMQERESGVFIDGYYVIPSEYDPVLVYDGVVLPDSEEESTIEMEML